MVVVVVVLSVKKRRIQVSCDHIGANPTHVSFSSPFSLLSTGDARFRTAALHGSVCRKLMIDALWISAPQPTINMGRLAGPVVRVRIPRRDLNFIYCFPQLLSGGLFGSVRRYHHRSRISSSTSAIGPFPFPNSLPRPSHSSRHRFTWPPSSASITFSMRRKRV